MGSHSVTCHPTQVNTPHRYSIYLPLGDGRLSWPSINTTSRVGVYIYRQSSHLLVKSPMMWSGNQSWMNMNPYSSIASQPMNQWINEWINQSISAIFNMAYAMNSDIYADIINIPVRSDHHHTVSVVKTPCPSILICVSTQINLWFT